MQLKSPHPCRLLILTVNGILCWAAREIGNACRFIQFLEPSTGIVPLNYCWRYCRCSREADKHVFVCTFLEKCNGTILDRNELVYVMAVIMEWAYQSRSVTPELKEVGPSLRSANGPYVDVRVIEHSEMTYSYLSKHVKVLDTSRALEYYSCWWFQKHVEWCHSYAIMAKFMRKCPNMYVFCSISAAVRKRDEDYFQ